MICIHSQLLYTLVLMDRPEDRGIYRRIPIRIMGAYHTPPESAVVPELMEKLIAEFAKKKLHPIESAALFHLKFLMQNGYPPISVKFTDHKRYYEAFDSYYRDNDDSAMVAMAAEYVEAT